MGRTKVETKCKHCEQTFLARPSELNAGRALYCSRVCVNKGRDQSGECNPNWIGGVTPAEKRRRYRMVHPEKEAAHRAVRNALRQGILVREPCEECGKDRVEAHHEDYTKPLDVKWLCKPHHLDAHRDL